MEYLKNNINNSSNDINNYISIRPFKCSLCDLIFDRISQLDNHKRSVHNKERSKICQICGKGFFRGTDLKTHLNIHLGINRCMCEICGKKFNHVSNLIRHGRTHSGIKPYPCTICGKRFTQINTLARHKVIHNRGDVTYDCCFCDKKYKTKNGLKEHMKKLHGFTENSSTNNDKIIRRKHYCNICGESFQYVELLRSHENNHNIKINNVNINDCKICLQKLVNHQDIKEHGCKKIKYPIDTSVKLIYENTINDTESLLKYNLIKRNDIDDTFINDDKKFTYKNVSLINEKIINDTDTKETIVYLRTEQLGNLNTDQLVIDTANHYLHEHLLELTNDNESDETVVSEMIKNCWKEIDITDNNSTPVIRLLNNENNDKNIDDDDDDDDDDNNLCSMREKETNIIEEEEEEEKKKKEKEEESMLKLVEFDETMRNKNDKIIYYAQNNSRDCLVDLFENDELCDNDNNSFNKITDELIKQNFDNTRENININNNNDNENCDVIFDRIEEKLLNNDNKLIEKIKIDNGPMVRLVQNEDGAQFFELIRRDLEEEEEEEEEKKKVEEEKEKESQEYGLIKTDKRYNKKEKDDKIICKNDVLKSILKMNKDIDDKRIINENYESELSNRKKRLKNNDNKKYNCDVCKKSFSKGYNYRQHIGTHFVDKQKYKCKECGQLFAWKSTLNKHIASHKAGGQQKFVCKICPKVYTTLSQVNEHVKRDHLKERNHECPYCGKTFFKKFDLKIHIRTHTKERPYECRVCYKSFHHQSHIIRHERIHSGERPYACNICDKTFTQLGSLKSHRQRHKELKIDILDYQMNEDDPLPQTIL